MKTHEKYIQWSPLSDLPSRVICERIHDDYDGFRIVLSEQSDLGSSKHGSRLLEITFDPAIAYRNIDESYRLRTFSEHDDRTGSFFVVKNSKWIAWLNEESCGMYQDQAITHYAFFTLNECIDVLSEFEPVAVWITE